MDREHHIRDRGLKEEDETRTDEAHKAYAEAAGRVAAELGCPFVDTRRGILDSMGSNWRDGLRDGLHLSAEGSAVVFRMLREVVESTYADIAPRDDAPMFLPYHADPSLHAIPPFVDV